MSATDWQTAARTKAAVAVALALASLLPGPAATPLAPAAIAPAAATPAPQAATVKLLTDRDGRGLSWVGTATIVGPRRADGRWDVLTAAHCVRQLDSAAVVVGRQSLPCTVQARDEAADCAWLVTKDKLDRLPFARLAERGPRPGAALWHAGFGSANKKQSGKALRTDSAGQLWTDLPGTFGDSGAGIFDRDGALVGVLAGSPNHHAPPGRKIVWGAGLRAVEALRARPAGAANKARAVRPACADGCRCGCSRGEACSCLRPHGERDNDWSWDANGKFWWRLRVAPARPPAAARRPPARHGG